MDYDIIDLINLEMRIRREAFQISDFDKKNSSSIEYVFSLETCTVIFFASQMYCDHVANFFIKENKNRNNRRFLTYRIKATPKSHGEVISLFCECIRKDLEISHRDDFYQFLNKNVSDRSERWVKLHGM